MTITVELPPEVEERFLAQTRVRGLSLDAYVKELLSLSSATPTQGKQLSPDDVNLLLDEASDLVPTPPAPLPDYAMDRNSIYSREDEW